MAAAIDNSSLLLYRVGPVLCCAPSLPVEGIIQPPPLTRPPGTNAEKPGIFRHSGHIVSSIELRYKFGVEAEHWAKPGRTIVTEIDPGRIGFWVDEILDVIDFPDSGWHPLPAHLPGGIFSRTLILASKIYLYAEFNQLYNIPTSGYLRVYIEQLLQEEKKPEETRQTNSNITTLSSGLSTPADKNISPHSVTTATNHQHGAIQTSPGSGTTTSLDTKASTTNTIRVHTPGPDKQKKQVHYNKNSNQSSHENNIAPCQLKKTAFARKPDSTNKPERNKPQQAVSATGNASGQNTAPSNKSVHTPTQVSDTHSTSVMPALFFLVFLIGAFAGLVWYFTQELNSPDQTVNIDNGQDVSVAENTPQTDSVQQGERPRPVETVPTPVPDIGMLDNNGDTSKETQVFKAEIQKEEAGITIILDVPADEAVFKKDEKAKQTGDIQSEGPGEEDPSRSMPVDIMSDELATQDKTKPIPEINEEPIAPRIITNEIIHIVVKGDTLWHIAIKYVNDPYKYPELAKLSNIKNPDLIYPGNRVRIIKRSRQPR